MIPHHYLLFIHIFIYLLFKDYRNYSKDVQHPFKWLGAESRQIPIILLIIQDNHFNIDDIKYISSMPHYTRQLTLKKIPS